MPMHVASQGLPGPDTKSSTTSRPSVRSRLGKRSVVAAALLARWVASAALRADRFSCRAAVHAASSARPGNTCEIQTVKAGRKAGSASTSQRCHFCCFFADMCAFNGCNTRV